jgi:pantothenate kinase
VTPLNNPPQHLISRLQSVEKRYLVGMAGLPGSGKSTYAASLVESVNALCGSTVMVGLGMDGFHLTKAQLRQMPDPEAAFARRGAPWTFDSAALLHTLRSLRENADRNTVAWPGFQHDIGDPIEAASLVAPETRLILVEGLYLLYDRDGWDKIGDCFDELWYLDTPLAVAMERLTARHMEAWHLTREAAQMRIAHNDGLNAEIVESTRHRANWLIAG